MCRAIANLSHREEYTWEDYAAPAHAPARELRQLRQPAAGGGQQGVRDQPENRYCSAWQCKEIVYHRRRIKTEEKAKVVAAVWRTELFQFVAALDILH